MKTYSGKYGKDTEKSNSLVDNLLKYPEISRTLVRQHQKYSLTYLLERAGRFSNAKVLADNSYEWKVLGRLNKPLVSHGYWDLDNDAAWTAATDDTQDVADTANEVFYASFKDDASNGHYVTVNRNDVVRFKGGAVALVLDADVTPTTSHGLTGNYKAVKFRLISGDVNGSDLYAGVVAGTIASAFGEGSTGTSVGQNQVYPDTYRNWLTISRKKKKVTGGQLTDVTWIEHNGQALWYFTAEELMIQEFMYQLELARWYGKRSAGLGATQTYPGETYTSTLTDVDGSAVQTGDGILAQIAGSNDDTYSSLTEEGLVDYIAALAKNANAAEGNEYVVMTGTDGRVQFHRAMKELLVGSQVVSSTNRGQGGGATVFDAKAGKDVELGVNFTSYNALGNKITVAHCPVFDDPNLHADTNESGKMVFLDFSAQGDASNIELIAKGADGYNRNYIRKYVPGMVNPYDYKGMMAANGDDAFECHVMSESGIIVRNPLSCGILTKTA